MNKLVKNRTGRRRSHQVLDRQIGARIRQRRILLGLNQDQLAEMVGVTFQQMYKYEKGLNRITAGRLYTIAQALSADISFFFEDLSDHQNFKATPQRRSLLELVRNFSLITDRRRRAALSSLVRAVANTTTHDDNALETKPDPDLPAS